METPREIDEAIKEDDERRECRQLETLRTLKSTVELAI